MTMHQLHLQYDRLARHYNLALPGNDLVAFLDLAHALRIWVELKSVVTEIAQRHALQLQLTHHTPPKFIKRSLQGATQISIPLAGGVESPGVQVQGIRITNRALTPEEIARRAAAGPPVAQVSQMNFGEWMGAGVIEVPSENQDHPHMMISREILIKRVANILGASHPAGSDKADEYENRFDAPVLEIHKIQVADGYPATYYQLLAIAKEILVKVRVLRDISP